MYCGPGLLSPGYLLVLLAVAATGQIHVQSYLENDRVQHLPTGGSTLSDSDSLAEGNPERHRSAQANGNSTANLIFESIGSLLQTWGNTRRRNG